MAQSTKTRILFVFDASGSMAAQYGKKTRFQAAREILVKTIDSLESVTPNVEFALRVYGHQSPNAMMDCLDSKLEVPFGRGNAVRVKDFLNSIKPLGNTPIAYSLSEGVNDFPGEMNVRNIIVVITDGLETCEGDPCALAAQFRARNITLKPFIIGMALGPKGADYFKCVGTYFDASNEQQFQGVMEVVITQSMYVTTAQINLLDQAGLANETDVEVTLYDAQTGELLYNYVHALRSGGLPDTLHLDPSIIYDMTAHTIPPVEVRNVELTAGKHNIVAAQTPQGTLVLKVSGTLDVSTTQCVVRRAGDNEILEVQNLNSRKKYLVGNYDIEVLTLPKLDFKNVKIANSKESEIVVPEPGTLQLRSATPGLVSIFMNVDGRPVKIYDSSLREPQSLRIQPGDYEVVFRTSAIRSARLTQVKKARIGPRSSTLIQF